ncbi:MAG: hypothetical protein Q9219_006503 [cf. Caloplaca sp. 3 TL-2023]
MAVYRSHHNAGSSWSAKVHLNGGSNWRNQYERANFALEIITILALLAIFIWASRVQKRSSTARNFFVWFMAAISFAIISFTWSAINIILNEETVAVAQIYIIFDTIFQTFFQIADILLLAAVLNLLVLYMAIAGITKVRATSKISRAHLAFCLVLAVFCIVYLALALAFSIERVERGTGSSNLRDIFNAARKINFVYDILYLLVVLEISVWSSILLCSPNSSSVPISRRTLPILILTAALSLLIRALWTLVTDGLYYLTTPSSRLETQETRLARQIFYYVCTIAVYAILVIAASRLQADDTTSFEDMYRGMEEEEEEANKMLPPTGLVVPKVEVEHWKRDSGRDHAQDPILHEQQEGGEVRDV